MDSHRTVCALGLTLALLGCGARPRAPASSDACSMARRRAHGGDFFRAPDGADVWFERAGPPGTTALVLVHGGPGYNALTFAESSGRLLAARRPVLYFDQRGCGRSGGVPASQLGMGRTIADLEALREHAGIARVVLVGHSFGGAVAAEYARRYPDRVAGIVMVDTTPELSRALAHQVAHADAIAEQTFPAQAAAVHAIAAGAGTPFEKLARVYQAIGRLPLQRALHYADPRAQEAMERIDEASGYLRCTDSAVVDAFLEEGYLSERVPSVAAPLPAPTLLVAGRASEVIGAANIADAAATWNARLVWLDAGHFVYFEQPAAFVSTVEAFLDEIGFAPTR